MTTKFLPLLALVLPTLASAATLSTGTATNNGTGGVFLQLTPTTQALQLQGFATVFASVAGTGVSVEVWTRSGSYTGFTASNVGWTLVETVTGTSAGNSAESGLISLTAPILLPFGQDTSVYLHSITSGGGIRYFGTGTTSTATYSNADLTLFTDTSRTGLVPFGGSQFNPRAFVGTLSYVPEPGSLASLGVVAFGFTLRRRR